ncbi:hypothetical protein [Methanococcoides methylutens]|nr:hypothetical protein [Methanococcoides methylutens]
MDNKSVDLFFEMLLQSETEKKIIQLISQGLSAEEVLEKLLEMEVENDD